MVYRVFLPFPYFPLLPCVLSPLPRVHITPLATEVAQSSAVCRDPASERVRVLLRLCARGGTGPGHSHVVVQSVPAERGRGGRGGPVVLEGGGRPVGGCGGGRGGPGLGLVGPGGPLVLAGEAEQCATDERQGRGDEAEVQGLPELELHAAGQQRVVEVLHHVVGGPGDGHHAQQAGQDEERAAQRGGRGLGGRALGAARALHAHHGAGARHARQQAGDDHERAGRLQVSRQRQQRAVDLALVDARAVPHALHPQPLQVGHGRQDVGAHVRCAAPVRQDGGDERAHQAQEAEQEAQQLHSRAGHGLAGRLPGLLRRPPES